jgi:ABC-type multidrug transport system fused ATPase/permease subunit
MRVFQSAEVAWLVRQARPLLPLHALGLVSIAGGSVLTLLDPLIMKWLIDTVLPNGNQRLLLLGTAGFAALYLARLGLTCGGSLVTFTAMQKMTFRVRIELLRGLHRHPRRYREEIPVGEMLYRIEQDVSRVGELGAEMLPNVARMLLVSVMVVTTLCLLNLRLSSLVLPLLPIFYLLQGRCRAQLVRAADESQLELGSMSAILQEHLAGMVQLELLNRQGRHARKYARQSAKGARAQVAQRLAEVRLSAAYLSVIVLGSTLILGYGGHEVIDGRLTVGGLVAFYSYVTRLFEPLSIAIDLKSRAQRVRASVRRILELERMEENQEFKRKRRIDRELSATLEFCCVSYFHRAERSTLHGLTFRVPAGEKIAFIGPSGCGKSTIAYLAAGLYKPDTGTIFVNGHDLDSIDRRNLRSIISLVPQDPILFEGTVRENLLYGNPGATNHDLEWVLSLAQLEELVRALPGGLDGHLGPMGRRLSGGEKKRVAVARAILMRPQILILDEVTSGLDGSSAMRMLRALDECQDGTTILFISHEAKTISWADRIVVLSHGRIIDDGCHFDLIGRCATYQEIQCGCSDTRLFQNE